MADENLPSTEETTTTTETTTALGDGLAKVTDPTTPKEDGTPPEAKLEGPPEKYEWKLPEGFKADEDGLKEVEPLFKEFGLSQERAQKLIDAYTKYMTKAHETREKGLMDSWTKTRTDWRNDLKKDEVVGKLVGENGNFGPDSELVLTVNRALESLDNPKLVSAFKDAMDFTGAGDNPAFVKVFYALASKVTEGRSYAAGGPSPLDPRTGQPRGARPSAGAALYPHLPSSSGG